MKIYKIDLIDNKKIDIKNPETIWNAIPVRLLSEKCRILLWETYINELNNIWRKYITENNPYNNIEFEIITDIEWEVIYMNTEVLE